MTTAPLSPTRLDARIVKTLASIERAFLSLLSQKAYDEITVGDILEDANINRTTFYKYYDNKNDLATTMVNDLKTNFFEPMLDRRFHLSWEEFSKEIPNFCEEHQQKVERLWQIRTPKINLKNDVYHLVKAKYINACQHKAQSYEQNLDFQGHIYATFFVAMVEYQFNHHNSCLELDDAYHNLQHVFEHILS